LHYTLNIMKNLFASFLFIFCVGATRSQTVIYQTNFGTIANVNPPSWSFTGIGMNITNVNNTSAGYSGVSGSNYLGEGNSNTFTNTAGNSQGTSSTSPTGYSAATLTISTLTYTSVNLSFGMRKSSGSYNSAATYSLEWSTNGTTYTQINYSEAPSGSWGLATGAGLSLPAGATNQPILYIRWAFNRTATNSNFKIDDVQVTSGTGGGGGSNNPTIQVYGSSTKYLSLAGSSGGASGVINDPTDPCKIKGITFLLKDGNTPLNTLTLSASSSNNGVVTNANVNFTYVNDSIRNLKVTPTGVGYSNITVTVNDGSSTANYIINYAASAAAYTVPATDFHTGISDASTGIEVGNGYFLSGDDESNALHLYHKDSSGYFFNAYDLAAPMALAGEGDFEASTRKGNKIYWMGSLGNSKSGNIQTSRHRFFATSVTGSGSLTTSAYLGSQELRSSITSWGDANGYNFTASGASGMIPKQIGGLNVEGLCLGPNDTSLYIGFRAPLVPVSNRTKALICPVKNFEAWFNNGSPIGNPTYGTPIELNLGGRGIRSLEKNANGQYLIVAGSFDSTHNPALYEWNGNPMSAPVLLTADLTSINPEGILSFPSPFYNGSIVELISDDGTQIWYNDAVENKDLPERKHKKFRTVKVVTTGGTLTNPTTVLKQNTLALDFSIYPNPVADVLSIHNSESTDYNVAIYNSIGELVLMHHNQGNKAVIYLSALSSGVYFVNISTVNGLVAKKFLKE
jgi:hypothetical protein